MQEETPEISPGGPGSQQPMENIIIRVYLATNSPSAPLENITFSGEKKKKQHKNHLTTRTVRHWNRSHREVAESLDS